MSFFLLRITIVDARFKTDSVKESLTSSNHFAVFMSKTRIYYYI